MERILAVFIDDHEYALSLASYLNSRDDFLLRAEVFTSEDRLMSFARQDHIDLLLTVPCMMREAPETTGASRICILGGSPEDSDPQYPVVYRYMPADRIMRDLVAAYRGQTISASIPENCDRSHIFSVCTPVGGSFASSFALSLAVYLSGRGRTLFVGFDPFFILPPDLRRTTERNMTDVLYYLETYGSDPGGMITGIAARSGDLDCISGVSHWSDTADITAEHMMRLLSAITGGRYEFIVFDVGLAGRGSDVILSASGTVFVPTGRNGGKRLAEWKRQLTFTGKGSLASGLRELEIPYDEVLEGEPETAQLLDGPVGRLLEGLEEMGYFK